MKTVYLKGTTILNDDQRKKYAGCRFENADAFTTVSGDVKSAEIIGDYPNIEKALKDAGIPIEGGKTEPKKKETPKTEKPKAKAKK